MNTGMRMLAASTMRRQRDSRGRYMEGNQGGRMEGNQNAYSRMEGNQGAYNTGGANGNTNRMAGGGGNYGYSGGNSRMEGRMAEMTGGEDFSPYGPQPEVYRRQEKPQNVYRDNTVSLDAWKHKTDPMNQKDGKQRMIGFKSNEEEGDKLDKKTAMEWVEKMEDASGVKGGRYTWHQAQQMAQNVGMHGEEKMIEFFAIVNAMYSDYCMVAKKFGVDKPDFFAHLAKAFIEDADAVENKVYKYYECIAK